MTFTQKSPEACYKLQKEAHCHKNAASLGEPNQPFDRLLLCYIGHKGNILRHNLVYNQVRSDWDDCVNCSVLVKIL